MIHNIARLFEKVGPDKEAEAVKWIKKFSSYEGVFAVLKIGGDSIKSSPNEICEDLAILSKLDLYAPVVYGWGNAFTEKLERQGITTLKDRKTQVRITKKEDLPFLEEIAHEQGSVLTDNLRARGIASEIVYGVFTAQKMHLEDATSDHYTGEIIRINKEKISDNQRKGIISLLPPVGITEDGKLMNINGDSAAKSVVMTLNPSKCIMFTDIGGVYDLKKQLIPYISIANDYQRLVDSGILTDGMFVKVEQARDILINSKDPSLAVHIAHPKNLIPELFTDTGIGTYITR